MIVQTLDDKRHCLGVYHDGKLIYECDEFDFNAITATWNYNPIFQQKPATIASLLVQNKSLAAVCPEYLKTRWEAISTRLQAFHKSFTTAKVSLTINCFYDIVPERFLLEYCEIKNQITKHVIENNAIPSNYDFLRELSAFAHDIKQNKLNIDYRIIARDSHKLKVKNFINKNMKSSPYVSYNIFGTKTGRLTTNKGFFPIMTLDSDYRKIIKPNNDYFVELDYNAAELRVLLSLAGKSQPEDDIHQWNVDVVYGGLITREQAKKGIFSWLYNPRAKEPLAEKIYDRELVLKRFWNGQSVTTPYKRLIPADRHHALNYLIQSTTSDLVLTKAMKIAETLKNRKSFISFTLHDSIVMDFADEDRELIEEIISIFSETKFGTFQVNLSGGRSFGEMKRIRQ